MTVGHAEALTSVNINGEDVAVTPSFNYLGSILSRQRGYEEDIKQHIDKAASVMNSLHKQLWSQRAVSDQASHLQGRRALLLSYGSET